MNLLSIRAKPKSQSLTMPFRLTRMFSGFMSLWMACLCAYVRVYVHSGRSLFNVALLPYPVLMAVVDPS